MVPVRVCLAIYVSKDTDFQDVSLVVDGDTIPNMYLQADFGIKDALQALVSRYIQGWRLNWMQFTHVIATEHRAENSWEIDITYKLLLAKIPVSQGQLVSITDLHSVNMTDRDITQVQLSLSR